METDWKGDSNVERRHSSVSYLQRACSPLPELLILRIYCCSQDALPTQNVGIWHPRIETQSAIFLVRWWTPLTNPIDSNLRFNSPFNYICVMWGSVSFAQKWPVTVSFRGDTSHLYTLSAFQSLCCLIFAQVNNACTLATSARIAAVSTPVASTNKNALNKSNTVHGGIQSRSFQRDWKWVPGVQPAESAAPVSLLPLIFLPSLRLTAPAH